MDETNYCENCFAQATGVRLVDFTDNPFATCTACGASANDSDGLIVTQPVENPAVAV